MFLDFTQTWFLNELFVILQKAYVWKMLSANQIAVFFYHQYLWKQSNDILVIFDGVGLQAKTASEKVVVWSDVARFAFHAIRLHDSLTINIFRENQLISYFFFHVVSHQGKVASETDWVLPVKFFVKLDCRIL